MTKYWQSKSVKGCVILLFMFSDTVNSEQKNLPQFLAMQRPVIHLSFDDGTGNDMALDTSVNMNDGSLTNMDSATDWVDGMASFAIDTDGVNDYISVADDASLDFGTDDFTVSYWFNKNSDTNAYSYGVSKWNQGSSPGTNEWLLNPATGFNPQINKVSFVIEIGNTGYGVADANAFSLNTWHQLVGVRDKSKLSIYLNGILVASRNDVPVDGAINNIGLELRIGTNQVQSPTFPMDGQFDDLQIYRFAATDGNIAIGEEATEQIAFLFNNPGLELPVIELIFNNSFEDI